MTTDYPKKKLITNLKGSNRSRGQSLIVDDDDDDDDDGLQYL